MIDLGLANLAEEIQIPYQRTIKMRKRNFAEESSTVAEGFCAHLEEAYGPTGVYW